MKINKIFDYLKEIINDKKHKKSNKNDIEELIEKLKIKKKDLEKEKYEKEKVKAIKKLIKKAQDKL